MKRFKRTKYGLSEDPRGRHVSFKYGSRELLGTVTHCYYDEVTGSVRLQVIYMNGEWWPIDPPAVNVEVIG